MNSARRLYGKKIDPFSTQRVKQSSFFKSKVQRKINNEPDSYLGPGQYEISLPLVKPIFETILKNDNTVIVKFNNHCSNAFQSKSPRFKYVESISEKRGLSHFEVKDMRYNQNPQHHYRQNAEGLAKALSRSLLICQVHENETLSPQGSKKTKKANLNVHRQNSTKRKTISHPISVNQQASTKELTQQEPVQYRTLPAASRLHNLEPNLIETKRFQSNRYNSSVKSTEWSKYKLQRRCFVDEVVSEDQPGPGAYAVKEPKFKAYNQRADITSWQFNSKTCRCPFEMSLGGQAGSLKYFNQSPERDIPQKFKAIEQTYQRERKQKMLKKKISRQRIFGLLRDSSQKGVADAQRNLSLEFTAIHSRENLFVEK